MTGYILYPELNNINVRCSTHGWFPRHCDRCTTTPFLCDCYHLWVKIIFIVKSYLLSLFVKCFIFCKIQFWALFCAMSFLACLKHFLLVECHYNARYITACISVCVKNKQGSLASSQATVLNLCLYNYGAKWTIRKA